jgi:dolichol-phosphate mannosyltransferase
MKEDTANHPFFSILLLAKNEGNNLKELIPKIHEEFLAIDATYEIVIIDGGSTDGSDKVCSNLNCKFFKQPGKGYADALRFAIKQCRGTYIINLDADHSHSPQYLKTLTEEARSEIWDLIIASRFLERRNHEMPLIRAVLSRVLSALCRVSIGLKTKDCSSGFRAYRTEPLKQCRLLGDDFSILLSVLTEFEIGGRTVCEVPFTYLGRQHGRSHVDYARFAISYGLGIYGCIQLAKDLKRKESQHGIT